MFVDLQYFKINQQHAFISMPIFPAHNWENSHVKPFYFGRDLTQQEQMVLIKTQDSR